MGPVDVNTAKSEDGVLLKSPGPNPEEWTVLIVLREERTKIPNQEQFVGQQVAFTQALQALQDGQWSVSITWNGRAMVGVNQDMLEGEFQTMLSLMAQEQPELPVQVQPLLLWCHR